MNPIAIGPPSATLALPLRYPCPPFVKTQHAPIYYPSAPIEILCHPLVLQVACVVLCSLPPASYAGVGCVCTPPSISPAFYAGSGCVFRSLSRLRDGFASSCCPVPPSEQPAPHSFVHFAEYYSAFASSFFICCQPPLVYSASNQHPSRLQNKFAPHSFVHFAEYYSALCFFLFCRLPADTCIFSPHHAVPNT